MFLLKSKRIRRSRSVRLGVSHLEDRLTPSNTFTGLGQAAPFGVLSFNNGSINLQRSSVVGDVGVANGGDFTARQSSLDGTLFLGSRVLTQYNQSFVPTGGVERADLRGAVADARAASQSFAGQTPLRTFQTLSRSLTLDGNGGTNVYRIRAVDYRNDTLTLNGGADDVFVFNVTGDFSFRNSRMVLNGVSANHVLFNFTSNNADVVVRNDNSVVFGTFLAPRGSVEIHDSGAFQGAVLARNVGLFAGAALDNGQDDPPPPPPPPPTGGTASLSGFVYFDNFGEGEGTRDPFETFGPGDVTLVLDGTTSQGQTIQLTTVSDESTGDGSGFFTFQNLPAGTYTLTAQVDPFWYFSTGSSAGTVNGQSNGSSSDSVTLVNIVLADGNAGLDYNFGVVSTGN